MNTLLIFLCGGLLAGTPLLAGELEPPAPARLSAQFHDDHIDLSDGRELTLNKNRLPHIGAQVFMEAPAGATVIISYDDGATSFTAKTPFIYKVPDDRVSAYFLLTVDEGGPDKTWQVRLQHESTVELEIRSEDEDEE